jgi:hypothetical protein
MYGPGYAPFRMSGTRLYHPEEIEAKMKRLDDARVKIFLEIEGRRIALNPGDHSLAAKVACAYHMGVNYQVTDSDDNHDSGNEALSEDESDPENSQEFSSEQP